MYSNLLNELESWTRVKNRPIWVENLVSELGVDKTLDLIKAIKFNEENKDALEFVNRVLTDENIRRIDFLM
jgi:recombinational DNA repair protein RecR